MRDPGARRARDDLAHRRPGLLAAALGLLAAGLWASGCATPVAPQGGPVDRTPPRLVGSVPAADSTGVRTDRVVLTFSEPVDAASLRRALAVVPEPSEPPRVQVSGRTATLTFADSLRPDQTIVLTLGSELQDLRQVRLQQPITLAFSTGETIDSVASIGVPTGNWTSTVNSKRP